MPITDCRSHHVREQLVKDFEILPLTHIRLLDGQIQVSCAGPILDREYYVFGFKSRHNSQDTGTFVCGVTVANDFIDLLRNNNQEVSRLPLIDPLENLEETRIIGSTIIKSGSKAEPQMPNWHPVTKELYEVICLICFIWNLAYLNDPLLSIQTNILRKPFQLPDNVDIRKVNTIIKKKFIVEDSQVPSLAGYLQRFMRTKNVSNPSLKTFPNLTTYYYERVANDWNPIPYFN